MSTELVPLSTEQYPVLKAGNTLADVMRENLAGEQISSDDLTRIRVPAGGATTWSVPSADGNEESCKTLEGVILHIAPRRAYWPQNAPAGDLPTCRSDDCVVGIGDPGGECDKCRYNQFGTTINVDGSTGRGKACKETRLIFLLRPRQMLPDVVAISPASVKLVRRYQLKLISLTLPYIAVVTQLELAKAVNRDGIAYSEVHPRLAGVLDPDTVASFRKYAEGLQGLFTKAEIEQADVGE